MNWVPSLVGVAMFIAGLWMLLRANDTVSDFEHDCMCVRDHEARISSLETTAKQLLHSGEVQAVDDPESWLVSTLMRQEVVLRD